MTTVFKNCQCILFSDDSVCIGRYSAIQDVLENLDKWCNVNSLQTNISKRNDIRFSKSNYPYTYLYLIYNIKMFFSAVTLVLIDSSTWFCWKLLECYCRICPRFCDLKDTKSVHNCLVRKREFSSDHWCELW